MLNLEVLFTCKVQIDACLFCRLQDIIYNQILFSFSLNLCVFHDNRYITIGYHSRLSISHTSPLPSPLGRSLQNFQMTQGGYQVMIILPIKAKWLLLRSGAFCDFCILLNLHLRHSKSEVYKMTMNLALVLVHISSRHSDLNFAHHFVIYWLFHNGANKNQHQD